MVARRKTPETTMNIRGVKKHKQRDFQPQDSGIASANAFSLYDQNNSVFPPDQQHTLQSVVKLAHKFTNRPVAIWLLDFRSQKLHIHAAEGLPENHIIQSSAALGDGSLISQVIETRTIQTIHDVQNDSRLGYRDCARAAGWGSIHAFPINSLELTCGVIEVFSIRGQQVGASEIDVFGNLADLARVAVEATYTLRGSQKLAHIARKLSSIPDFGRAMQVLIESACELIGADSGTIILLDKQTNKFTIGARAPVREDIPINLPRPRGGLTRAIINTGASIKINDSTKDPRVKEAVIKEGVRSLIGVRVQMEDERVGAMYVNGYHTAQFTDYDVSLLQMLADYASVAFSWARLLFKPSIQMEQTTFRLFNLDSVIKSVSEEIKEKMGFDFVALQLVRPAERFIETVYGTGVAEEWGNLAWKHYLEEDGALRDIQADIAMKRTPRIEIIGGWDERFDEWIYKTFSHDKLVRIFMPLVVVRDDNGKPIDDWFKNCKWKVVEDHKGERGWLIVLDMCLSNVDEDALQVIGTVEAGFTNPQREIKPRMARALAKLASDRALKIWEARLPHVLQTITECAMRIVGADSASLHYLYDPQQRRYVYEASCGQIGRRFLSVYQPREEGLGHQAIQDKKPKFMPDFSRGRDVLQLSSTNPEIYKKGIRAIAAFPLLVGNNTGVLYIHFQREHHFTEDEIGWVQLFVNWAVDSIGHYTTYRQTRERARQLASLHSVVQSLVGRPEEKDLLRHVAWSTLNTLAADVVTIYEYIEKENQFLYPPAIAGRLKKQSEMHRVVSEESAPALLVKEAGSVYALESLNNPIFNRSIHERSGEEDPAFVIREGIKSSAGIPLRVSDETVGVMIINYRRPHDFTEEEKTTMDVLASAAAIAIKNRRLLESLGEKLGENLNQGVREIITTLDLPNVLSLVLKRAVSITEADLGVISRLDPVTQELVIQAKYPTDERLAPSWTRIKIGEGITGWVAEKKQSALVNNLEEDSRHTAFYAENGSALCVPLQDKDGHVLGVLGVKSKQLSAFKRKHQKLLEVLANYAVVAIGNAENQKQLVAAEKIATLGNFAGPLLHWMKDEVGFMQSSALEIRTRKGVDVLGKKIAGEIESAADSILKQARHLKEWRASVTKQELINLRWAVFNARKRARIPARIKTIIKLSKEMPGIRSGRHQLIDVFINLIQNAVDAMPDGGKLIITGEGLKLEGRSWAIVRVEDTGAGIKKKYLKKIFQPKFTTKEDSKGGLGFGLWWTQTYVERLGGNLTVESRLGMGTKFTLLLPAHEK